MKRWRHMLLTGLLITSTLPLLNACSNIKTANLQYKDAQSAYKTRDYDTAFDKMQQSAKNGNIDAQYAMGYMLYYGIGIKADQVKALVILEKAASHGQIMAIKALNMLKHQGDASLYGGGASPFMASHNNQPNKP